MCVVLSSLSASNNAGFTGEFNDTNDYSPASFLGARVSCHTISVVWGKNHVLWNKLYHCKDARECLVDQNDLLCQPQQMQEMNTKKRQKVRKFGRYCLWH